MPEMITCPECKGKKQVVIFFCTYPGMGVVPCHVCDGKGTIENEQLKMKEFGEQVKADRIKRKVLLRDEAKRLNIDVTKLSKLERGLLKLHEVRALLLEPLSKERHI